MRLLPISQTDLKATFDYNPDDGYLYKRSTGKRVGHRNSRGYILVCYRGHAYLAHRLILIWLYGTGALARKRPCWINGKRDDNRGSNLCFK